MVTATHTSNTVTIYIAQQNTLCTLTSSTTSTGTVNTILKNLIAHCICVGYGSAIPACCEALSEHTRLWYAR